MINLEIQKQNIFFREIIDSIPNPFYVIDVLDYTIKIANKMAYKGKIPEGLTCHLLTHHSNTPCDSREHPCPLKEVLNTKKPVIVEHRHYDGQGVLKNVEVHGYPIFDADGNVAQYIETVVDITSRKEAEKALELEREKLRLLYDNSPDAIIITDKEKKIIYANKKTETVGGVSGGKLKGRPCFEAIIGRDAACEGCKMDEAMEMKSSRTYIKHEITGEKESWLEQLWYPVIDRDDNIESVVEIARDITDLKKTGEALQKHLDFIQKLIDAIPNPIYYKDTNGIYLGCNKSFEELHGRPKETIIGESAFDLFPEDHAENLNEKDQELVHEPGVQVHETALLYADGKIRDVIINKATFSDLDGTIAGLVGVVIDITERKRTEREINFLASIVRNMPDAVCAIDPENRIVFWNEGAERMFGYTSEEILGKDVRLIVPREYETEISHCFNFLNKQENIPTYESIRISKDGTRFPVEITAVPLYNINHNITGCASITKDIRRRKKMEKEILKASRIESIGVLAGGIAHDFNNLLTAIMSSISTVKDMVPPEEDINELLTIAQRASRNAKDLTHQLLSFAREDAPVREIGSVAELLRKTIKFVMSGSNIKYKLFIEENLLPVEMDKTQITQVIHNLALNAKEAMQDGGNLTIHVENSMVGENDNLPLRAGEYVKISICDEGPGIPEEILNRIFDPYFSTKQMGVKKGMGLGLALCYVIVKNHEGHIAVDSMVGEGTTFTIYLPASATEETEMHKEERRIITGTGRVLIMDDEEVIEQIAGIMFKRIGYEITFAKDGSETIRLYEQAMKSGQKFDIVILDLTIPGEGGGKETIKRLLAIDAGVKAIVSSGYSEDPVMANYRSYGFKGVLPKPYEVEELSEVIHTVLKEPV